MSVLHDKGTSVVLILVVLSPYPRLHYRLRILRLIVSRLICQGYSIGVLLIRYQVCWLLVSGDGEEGGYVAGS